MTHGPNTRLPFGRTWVSVADLAALAVAATVAGSSRKGLIGSTASTPVGIRLDDRATNIKTATCRIAVPRDLIPFSMVRDRIPMCHRHAKASSPRTVSQVSLKTDQEVAARGAGHALYLLTRDVRVSRDDVASDIWE